MHITENNNGYVPSYLFNIYLVMLSLYNTTVIICMHNFKNFISTVHIYKNNGCAKISTAVFVYLI